MELLANLVKGAIGYDADRGDQIEVIQMVFKDSINVEDLDEGIVSLQSRSIRESRKVPSIL